MTDPIIDREFEKLTPKRLLQNGNYFCICSGETCKAKGTRECTRQQLIQKQIGSCRRCAEANRRAPNKPMVIPKPELVKIKLPKCSSLCRMRDGWEYHDPACERLGIFNQLGVEFRRKPEPPVTGFI